MRLLAIDTALDACSVAVLDGDGEGARLTRASETLQRGHAERLLGMIGEVMAEAGIAFSELDRIGVTVGPGSFTGLRVGLSAARGIALVVRVPAVGVSTLAALAAQALRESGAEQAGSAVWATIAGRGADVYIQGFSADGTPLDAARAVAAEALGEELPDGACLAGNGAEKIVAATARGDLVVLHTHGWPAIEDVARLGAVADPQTARPEPLYLRPPDAAPARRDERLLA
ncbi:tRNA (adenosine(37)-N6)-threonylcarbamoyltransferase complex dimerization subunit type 1 TsaB [Stappia sp. ES.058]|uniref:tRNA (adenosine(37)-N6)-threonylcarbamoyltransferase complex dimerization subunit type 1 TsaB n=1 Tax=Stappia sp. ES.058 TaxID=1881061 RepID=UPI000B8564EA|nr:tRNA (adenosine(37)-N6)-threonylcarbamoyltransferase complex dimerization subunit type 1 TsaB [Stappia sp. ES.058]